MVTVNRTTALALLLLTTLFWGSSYAFTKALTGFFTPLWVVTFRFGLAGLVLLALVRKELIMALKTSRPADLLELCSLGLLNFAAIFCFTTSLKEIEVTNSGFIISASLLMVPFLEFLLRGKSLRCRTLIAVVLLGLGLYCMSFGFHSPKPFRRGEAVACVAALLYAGYILLIGSLSRKFHSGVIMCCIFLITALISCPAACASSGISFAPFAAFRICVDLAYLALIGTAIPYVFMAVGQRTLDNQTAAFIYILEPVFAMLIALLFFGESVSAEKWLGAGIILAGQYLAISRQGKR